MARKKAASEPKPRNDAYTVMLFITLVAIIVGCVLMYLDTEQYKEGVAPPPSPPLVLPKLGTTTVSTTGPGGLPPMAPGPDTATP